MSGSGGGDSEGRGVESRRTDLAPEAWTWHLLGLVLPLLVGAAFLSAGNHVLRGAPDTSAGASWCGPVRSWWGSGSCS